MKLPRRYPIIFNPKARSQKGGRVLRFIMKHANRFALYATNSAEEARELAARFAADGEPVVVAAGGDGKTGAQRLQDDGHDGRDQRHHQQRVAELGATGDRRRPVARIHVSDGDQIAWTDESRAPAPG